MLPSSDLAPPTAWSVVAQNLPEHALTPIHTDDGARAAGFPRSVAGVTTYAYLTHPVVAVWGTDWLATRRARRACAVRSSTATSCAAPPSPTPPRPTNSPPSWSAPLTDEPEQPRVVFRAVRRVAPRRPCATASDSARSACR